MLKYIFMFLVGFVVAGNYPDHAAQLAYELGLLWDDIILGIDLNVRGWYD